MLLCSKIDPDLKQHVMELLSREGMFPSSLSIQQQATAWIALYMNATVLERNSMLTLLGLRAKLQVSATRCGMQHLF